MEFIKKNITLIAIAIIGILILQKSCSINNIFGGGEVIITTDTVTTVVTNTTTVVDTNYRDSITTWYHQHPKKVKEYVYVDNNVPAISNSDTSIFNISDSIKLFTYMGNDSLLKYKIYVKGKEKPEEVYIEYDVSKTIITDSTYVRDSTVTEITNDITKKVRVNQIYIGPAAIIYPGLNGGLINVDFVSKNGWQLEAGIGYGNVNNSTELIGSIGFKKLISFRSKK